jgi:hypothetical protein
MVIFSVLFLIGYWHVSAATYYIDGGTGNDTCTGLSESLAWKTITKANQTLTAGDRVFIKAGTYNDYIAPVNSGTSPIDAITFQNYNTDQVTISDASYGILLNGKSYIVVQGINFTNLDKFLWLQNNANYNIIAHCNFDNGRNIGWSGSKIYRDSKYNQVVYCRFSKYGYYTDDDIGCVLDIGNENNTTDSTRSNLLDGCVFYHGGHHILGVYGMRNVIRNCYFHNEPWAMGTAASDRGAVLYGNRNISVAGHVENSGRNLFDGNRIAYSSDPSDNIGASGMACNTSGNIVRRNNFYNNDCAGLSMTLTQSYAQSIRHNRIYNNTFFNNGHNPDAYIRSKCGIFLAIYSGSMVIEHCVIKNNLLYKHRVPFDEYNINTGDRRGLLAQQTLVNNWDGDSLGNPAFVNASETFGNPMDSSLPDLRLLENSPCIDSGTYLTQITSASGSGTSFTVADAGYFMDGWGIIQGDSIQLFGTAQAARITSADYTANTITVNKSLTWTQNQGVSLAYIGAAPDIGAYEYPSTPAITKPAFDLPQQSGLTVHNQFSPAVKVSFYLNKSEDITISVYEMNGKKLATLINGIKEAGRHSIQWKAGNSGVYLVRMQQGKTIQTKRVFVVN